MKDYMYYTDDNGVECQEEIVLYTITSEKPTEIRFLTPSGVYMYKEPNPTDKELLPNPRLVIFRNKFYKYTGQTWSYMNWVKPYKEVEAKWEDVYNIDRICLRR